MASGRVPLAGRGDLLTSWLNPTSVLGGLIAVGTCTMLAGVFVIADARRSGAESLAEQLRLRTLAVGVVTGLLVLAALVPIHRDAPTLSHHLLGRALPLIVVSALAGLATLTLLVIRRYALARLTAVAAVAAVVAGWGVAQYPWLLADQLTIADGAGARATLVGLLVVVAIASVVVVPALVYLYWLTQTGRWSHVEATPVGD